MIGKPAGINSNPHEVWENNFNVIKNNVDEKFGNDLVEDLYEYYTEEIGINKLITYLEEQDRIDSLNNYGFMDFGMILKGNKKNNYIKKSKIDEDEESNSFKISNEAPKINIKVIKSNLLKFFLNELVEEIPTNSVFTSKEDVIDFIKSYQIKFLHEVVIPIANMDEDN